MQPKDYAALIDRVRDVASRLVGPARTELLSVASELEQVPAHLFKRSEARAMERSIARAKREKSKVVGKPVPSGDGAVATNVDRSNEERKQESINDVTAAVTALRQSHDWDNLKRTARIELLRQETCKHRGVPIGNATLYQDWIKELWQ